MMWQRARIITDAADELDDPRQRERLRRGRLIWVVAERPKPVACAIVQFPDGQEVSRMAIRSPIFRTNIRMGDTGATWSMPLWWPAEFPRKHPEAHDTLELLGGPENFAEDVETEEI